MKRFFQQAAWALCVLLGLLLSPACSAAAANTEAQNISATTPGWFTKTREVVARVSTSAEIKRFAWNEFKAFAFWAVVLLAIVSMVKGFAWDAWIYQILVLFMVSVMLNNYDVVMTALWNWSDSFAAAIQRAAISGNSGDPLAIGAAITSIINALTIEPSYTANPATLFAGGVGAVIVGAVAIVLGVLATFTSMWSAWGFFIAQMIGLMFIPFILFDRLTFLFDGWLRFTFGFMVYGVIARANLILVLIVLSVYLHIPLSTNAPAQIFTFTVENLKDVFGLLCFLLIGILALFSTGAFAATIVSGAGGGGIGRAMLGAARTVSRLATGGK